MITPTYIVQDVALFQHRNAPIPVYIPGLASMETHMHRDVFRVSEYYKMEFMLLPPTAKDKVTLEIEANKLEDSIKDLSERLAYVKAEMNLISVQEHIKATNR